MLQLKYFWWIIEQHEPLKMLLILLLLTQKLNSLYFFIEFVFNDLLFSIHLHIFLDCFSVKNIHIELSDIFIVLFLLLVIFIFGLIKF